MELAAGMGNTDQDIRARYIKLDVVNDPGLVQTKQAPIVVGKVAHPPRIQIPPNWAPTH